MENLVNYCNAANDEFKDMVKERKNLENQMNILMELFKIPEQGRNFEELKDQIEKMMEENIILTTQIQSNNAINIFVIAT